MTEFVARDRVAFDSALAIFAHDWDFGTITEVALRPSGYVYRIQWDDGYTDPVGTDAEWYTEDELTAVEKVNPNA